MKKTLALLTLSLLLVCAMIFGVSATIVEEDAEAGIGSYIRFDDQSTVLEYTTHYNGDISYDPDEGALKFDNWGNYVSAAYDTTSILSGPIRSTMRLIPLFVLPTNPSLPPRTAWR